MAQLTTTERAQLLSNLRFLQRMQIAVTKTAKYWNDFIVDVFNEYTVANQKRKVYARAVLNGNLPNQGYVATFLSAYNEEVTGNLEDDNLPFDAATNQLADDQLLDSPATPYAFDHHAGLKPGDETAQIQL